jgi:ABC-2 type transport system ATP-binding protein
VPANRPTIARVENVSKRFVLRKETSLKERLLHPRSRGEEFWALRDVNAEIPAGATVGLVGANGSGKSTLLKVIGAIIQPTTGRVERRGRLAPLLELGAGFHPDLTGRENVFLNASLLGVSQRDTARQFDEIVEFSGIEDFIDTQVKFYSSGMYVRLAFSVAVHVDPDLLLVDEVLAVGDEPFQRKCMDKIRAFQSEGRTIVLVSHSAEQVGELCDRVILLRAGRVAYDGSPAIAIRRLRAGFEEDRESAEDEHYDAHHATITSVEVLDSTGTPVTSIATGDEVTIRVNIDPAGGLPGWMVAISIETSIGQTLFRFTNQTGGVEMPPLASSPAAVDFRLPSLPLGEGSYSISAGIGDETGSTIHRVPGATTFAVRGPHLGTGVLGLEPTVALVTG